MYLKSWLDIAFFMTPVLAGFYTKQKCPFTEESTSPLDMRYFEIFWPIFYIFMGYSWIVVRGLAHGKIGGIHSRVLFDMLFATQTILSNLWIKSFVCDQDAKTSLYILIALMFVTLAIVALSSNFTVLPGILMTPFLVWLFVAQRANWEKYKTQQQTIVNAAAPQS